MIPRHRPPFGIPTVLRAVLTNFRTISVEVIENAYAEAFGLYAVLLPSARAGISWALKSAAEPETSVIGPAYTCQVVHEAMARSGCRFRLIDTESSSFLMDPQSLSDETFENCAIVLCEMYGYSYESYSLPVTPRMRIIDAAMTVPTPQVFERARANDCVMLSFGIGKCLYSGFGGIGLSKNKDLTDEIRSRRDANLSKAGLLLSIMRGAEIVFRTLAHASLIYRFSSKLRRPPADLETFPSDWSSDKNSSKEWQLPSTNLDLRLAIYNLEHCDEFYQRRIYLAHRYQRNLVGVTGVLLPRSSLYAMSHYTIRVPEQSRQGIQTALRRLGVDTGTLYKFPSYLSRYTYPNAGRLGSEVLNLPLDARLTDEDVDYVCDCVIRCVSEIWSTRDQIGHDTRRVAEIQPRIH